jgi:hypothetical protein
MFITFDICLNKVDKKLQKGVQFFMTSKLKWSYYFFIWLYVTMTSVSFAQDVVWCSDLDKLAPACPDKESSLVPTIPKTVEDLHQAVGDLEDKVDLSLPEAISTSGTLTGKAIFQSDLSLGEDYLKLYESELAALSAGNSAAEKSHLHTSECAHSPEHIAWLKERLESLQPPFQKLAYQLGVKDSDKGKLKAYSDLLYPSHLSFQVPIT